MILRQPDRPPAEAGPSTWTAPWRHAAYGRVLIFYLRWLFAIGLASPFYTAHLIKNLHWDFRGLAVLGMMSAGTPMLCNPGWGRAMDRFGHRPILWLSALGILHLPWYDVLCPPGTVWPIYWHAVLTGLFWSGCNLAIFSLVMDDLPLVGRPYYFAFAAALSGGANFLALLCGGLLAEAWSAAAVPIGGLFLGHYQLLFLCTAALRAPALLLIARIQEPDAKPSLVVIRQAFIEVNRRLGLGRQVVLLSTNTQRRRPPSPGPGRGGRSSTNP